MCDYGAMLQDALPLADAFAEGLRAANNFERGMQDIAKALSGREERLAALHAHVREGARKPKPRLDG